MKINVIQKNLLLLIIALTSLYGCKTEPFHITKDSDKVTSYVDPFIGTGGHGHTYPGATVPFGMLQVSPINGVNGWDWCSGYNYSDNIAVGFSHLALSGTGIGDLLDIAFMPINKKVDLSKYFESRDSIPYKSTYSHNNEKASPGYYQVFLEDPEVNVELTSSQRTAYHKYTFTKDDQQSVIIDLGYGTNWDSTTKTQITVEDDYTLTGFRFSTGWAKNQKVFFVAKFSKPIKNHNIYSDGNLADAKSTKGVKTASQLFFNNSNTVLRVNVALSSVSIANAKDNLDTENFDFEKIKVIGDNIWNTAIAKIKVETPIDSLKTMFYTAMYHAQLAPVTFSDKNGEYRKENDTIAIASDYTAYSTLSLWDTFRAEHPLLTLIAPNEVTDIIRTMMSYYETNKILPVWTLYGNETNTMTGYHSIPVIVEAYQKGIRDFDAEKAYQAMKTTMMQNARGLKEYKKYGYIPYTLIEESVTITLEYAYDDWCVAQMAKALGKEEDYLFFSKRAKAYQNLFDKNTGFMRAKSVDGKSWSLPFDPKYAAHRHGANYTEGNAWQHSWFVPHDVENLISIHGGAEIFTARLEQLFTESSEINGDNASPDISGLIGQYAHGNEPSHHIAYLFNHANKPWRTQYWVREILKTQYSTLSSGLSGNEDCGQMSAWYILSSIGFYSVNPASGTYEIGSPIFEKTTITLSEEKSFIIEAVNVSDKNKYIQSASLNGNVFNQTTISHQQILAGGTLHFVMGSVPNKKWGVNNKVNK